MQNPTLAIVGNRVVLGTAVIEEDDRVILPAMPYLELRRFHVLEEEGQHSAALSLLQLADQSRRFEFTKISFRRVMRCAGTSGWTTGERRR